MKILCLHGSYGSASHFQVQLTSVVNALQKLGSVEFKWINGGHTAIPPPGFATYFGPPPLYHFIDREDDSRSEEKLARIRELPQGITVEDTIRSLARGEDVFPMSAVKSALDRVCEILDEDPEIDGVLGYSEGATMAASLILEERRRREEEGRPRRVKYAIFFAGWPPLRLHNDSVQCLLADECEDTLDVPTCHIVGSNDPYIHGAMALFGVCDEDRATLFDHGKGHTVPRDAKTIHELALAIQETWSKREPWI